jgi:hypothetical protein
MSGDLKKKIDELDQDPEKQEEYKEKWERFKP